MLLILGPIGLGGLLKEVGDLGLEVGVGAVGRRGGVGLDLGPPCSTQASDPQ